MKVLEDRYRIIKDGYNGKTRRFISLSDLHYSTLQQLFYKGYMQKYFDYIIKTNKDKNIDIILIPGDLLFWLSDYRDKDFVKALKRDLENLTYQLSAPICVSYGNHDLPFEENLSEREKREWDLANHVENPSEGIFVLNNKQKRFDDIVVTGFSPVRSAYNPVYMPNKVLDKTMDVAKETFDKCSFSFNKDDLNILMSHNNKFFTHEKVIAHYNDLFDYLTFIIGGHLHDGYMPLWLQNMFKDKLKDYGFWESIPNIVIDMCRGAFKVSSVKTRDAILPNRDSYADIWLESDETASIVNRGVAKYSWFIPSTPNFVSIEVVPNKVLSLK